jgi:hypothetical protein
MMQGLFLRAIHAVLFTNPYTIDNKLEFTSEFIRNVSRIFSNDPNILTAPQNAPPQVPRIEIRNPDQSYIAQFGHNHIAFLYQDTRNLHPTLVSLFPHFFECLNCEVQSTMEFINPRILRLGCVIRLITEIGSSANKYLSEEVFKENLFSDAHEINIGILHKLSLENFTVNRWVRYQTLRNANDPTLDYALSIDIDLNTLSEQMYDFTVSEILNFFKLSFEHVTTSLSNFPLLKMGTGDDSSG